MTKIEVGTLPQSMREGQIAPSGVTFEQFVEHEARLLDALTAEGFDVSLYDSAFNPYPFLLSRERHRDLISLQDTVRRAITAVVENYSSDERLREVIRLPDAEQVIVDSLAAFPYRPGSFRPDFVHGVDGEIHITEINARFAVNAYFSSAVLNRVSSKLYSGISPLPGLFDLEVRLRERLGNSGNLGIVRSNEPGWDIFFFQTWWKGGCESALPQSVTAEKLAEWKSVVLELEQAEIAREFGMMLHPLARHPGLLNDLRTIFVAHDKRLLALLSTSPVMRDYLETSDIERLSRQVVPTWVKGLSSERVQEAMEIPHDWIAKPPRSGKGRGILLSNSMSPDEWRKALRELADDWILQPYIEQASFPVVIREGDDVKTQPMKVVGLLPALDGFSFGPGIYRASTDDIVNVARGGLVLMPALPSEPGAKDD